MKVGPVAGLVLLAGLGIGGCVFLSDPLNRFAVSMSVASLTAPNTLAPAGEYVALDRSAPPRRVLEQLYHGGAFAIMELKQVYVLPSGDPLWAARVSDLHGVAILLLRFRSGYALKPGSEGGWAITRYPDRG